ncbi:MAG: tRNA pseudouridine(13) synthase TruD [Deltaproteobacteria bacterium]|nr:tRNA pseudouridine(13) synthase TruD [Deltaproteobacteria bacterium]
MSNGPTFSPSPETFLVEEISAYSPSGTGEHTFVWIEKRGLTTFDAINQLARRLGVESRAIGYAGMKDKHATTRQWLSIPRVAAELALQAGDEQLLVLRAERHGNKLRVGHLRGNRFEVVVTNIGADEIARRLSKFATDGLPNRYGEQRFGVRADNTARGLAVLRGEQRERDHRRRRLLLSAVQSAVFNQVLDLRAAAGQLRQVLTGDVLQKSDSGGVFITDDPETDQRRLDAGDIVVTGPMPGGWAHEPPAETQARAIEDQALAAVGATREEFSSVGRDLPGTRRPLLVPIVLDPPSAIPVAEDPNAVRLRFQLPAGTYATVLLDALGVCVVPAQR